MTTSIRQWSDSAAGNNATVAGINFAEGQLPSTVNNSARELMAQVRQWYHPDEAGWIDWGATASVASQTAFRLAGDQTAMCVAGRRLRLRGGSVAARYASIVSASFSSETTVTLADTDGSLSASMSIVGLASVSPATMSRRIEKIDVSATAGAASVLVGDGSVAAPALAFGADKDTGIYRTSATTSQTTQVRVGVNGNAVAGFSYDGANGTGQLLMGSATPYNNNAGDLGIISVRGTVGNFVPIAITYSTGQPAIVVDQKSAAGSAMIYLQTTTTSSSGFSFLTALSRGGDTEFNFRGDGTGLCDGSFTGGGADFAELREWDDSNPSATDRTGVSVVLAMGGKIRIARPNEDPIGVISARPTVVGGNPLGWPSRCVLDDFGREALDEIGARIPNPDYDETRAYVTRDLRPEWAAVGLLGFVPVRNGQAISPRWVRSRRISDAVTEWLVR